MKSLLSRLENAPEGSRELDLDIHLQAGDLGDDFDLGDLNTEPNWLPHYTTSLDAKLPGENIVQVHAPGWNAAIPEGRWQAVHATDVAHGVYGYGHTEALARRIASLRARE